MSGVNTTELRNYAQATQSKFLYACADALDACRRELADAQGKDFIETSNIDLVREELRRRGLTVWDNCIGHWLSSGGAAYSAEAYREEVEHSDRLAETVGDALYALDPNQGEPPDPVLAAMILRSALPVDHPNHVTAEALAAFRAVSPGEAKP